MQYEVMASSEARAERLKKLRRMVKVSRRILAERYRISAGTLQNWETARFGGLTEKGARAVLQALRKEGVICSYEWLMMGVGHGPSVELGVTDHGCDELSSPKVSTQKNDVDFFMQLYPHATSYTLKDNSMAPVLSAKDIVVAFKYQDWAEATGKLCLIEFFQGHKLVRFVSKVVANSVSFYAANMRSHAAILHGEAVQVKSVSGIAWVRRSTDTT